MENNKRVVLTLALVAVIAVAAIGVGYAYQAATSNSGNSADIGYITLTPTTDGNTGSYSQIFNGNTLKFDTVSWKDNTTEKVTYTLESEQSAAIDGAKNYKATTGSDDYTTKVIKLGETLVLKIDRVNVTNDISIEMSHIAGRISTDFNYVIAYKIAEEYANLATATPYVKAYDTQSGCTILCPGDQTEFIGENNKFNATAKYIAVGLYVVSMNPQTLDRGSEYLSDPLDDVTFKFVASTTSITGHLLVLDYDSADGTITPETGKSLTQTFYNTDTIELTFTGLNGKTNIAVKVNGVDTPLAEGKCTITFTDSDMVVSATFTEP